MKFVYLMAAGLLLALALAGCGGNNAEPTLQPFTRPDRDPVQRASDLAASFTGLNLRTPIQPNMALTDQAQAEAFLTAIVFPATADAWYFLHGPTTARALPNAADMALAAGQLLSGTAGVRGRARTEVAIDLTATSGIHWTGAMTNDGEHFSLQAEGASPDGGCITLTVHSTNTATTERRTFSGEYRLAVRQPICDTPGGATTATAVYQGSSTGNLAMAGVTVNTACALTSTIAGLRTCEDDGNVLFTLVPDESSLSGFAPVITLQRRQTLRAADGYWVTAQADLTAAGSALTGQATWRASDGMTATLDGQSGRIADASCEAIATLAYDPSRTVLLVDYLDNTTVSDLVVPFYWARR